MNNSGSSSSSLKVNIGGSVVSDSFFSSDEESDKDAVATFIADRKRKRSSLKQAARLDEQKKAALSTPPKKIKMEKGYKAATPKDLILPADTLKKNKSVTFSSQPPNPASQKHLLGTESILDVPDDWDCEIGEPETTEFLSPPSPPHPYTIVSFYSFFFFKFM
jgi:hypothetical protein